MSAQDPIKEDILKIVEGVFSPAAVGPDRYNETIARIRSRAGAYLDVFEGMFLGTQFHPEAQSNLYLAAFLNLLKDVETERVRTMTEALLTQYDAVLVVFDQVTDRSMLDQLLPSTSADFLLRLNDKRDALRRLLQ